VSCLNSFGVASNPETIYIPPAPLAARSVAYISAVLPSSSDASAKGH